MRILFLVAFVSLLFPYSTLAGTIVRSGEMISISDDQILEGDFYGLGRTVAMSGKATEDLMLAGTDVTVNGEIGQDLMIAGGVVDVHGTIADDVRVVGGTVVVAGDVAGNLVVLASDLKVLSTATIGGDVLFYGETADISGIVNKNIRGTSKKMRIDGKVNAVDVKTGDLVLGSRTEIANNISYDSPHELTRAQEAKVSGKIIYTNNTPKTQNNFRSSVIVLLVFLFSSLVVHLFLRPFSSRVVDSTQGYVLRYLVIGFGVIFLLPIAGFILLVSTLGSVLGILLVSLYLTLLCLTVAMLGVVVGSLLRQLTKKPKDISILTVVIGVLIVNLLLYIPFVGTFIFIGLMLLTLGIITEKLIQLMRSQ